VNRTVRREFREDGTLIVRWMDSGAETSGTWRQEGDRFYFSYPEVKYSLQIERGYRLVDVDGVEPAAKDKWFTIEDRIYNLLSAHLPLNSRNSARGRFVRLSPGR
jgi:hypothetical protein